uniref:Crinkler effector protein N-terminal domain-containing protein n=1 Tax=Rhizophagus irregularis (strain DAOM 181602 / DAOM 197198 / MUCL 43194) TaxID=747089 RepID=U9URH1_RHIID
MGFVVKRYRIEYHKLNHLTHQSWLKDKLLHAVKTKPIEQKVDINDAFAYDYDQLRVIKECERVKQKCDNEEKENFNPSLKHFQSIISPVCLVKGNTIANAFPVDIDRNQLVRHLKKGIREKIDISENVKAKDLKLWKVEIPDNHNN